MSILFAATYPERTAGLITVGSFPRRVWAPDFPYGPSRHDYDRFIEQAVRAGRYLAEHIPGARLAELPGVDHLPFVGNADEIECS